MQPERPAQTTLAFHASRILIDVGVLLAMASMSLAFIEADSGNRSALDADALPALLLLLPIFVVTLIPDHTRPLHPVAGWTALAFGLAALPYAVLKMLDAAILADTLDGSLGFGSRLMVIGCLVTLVGIGIGLYRTLRGLPSGGTPGRSSTFRTRPKPATAPERAPGSEESPSPSPSATPAPPSDPSPAEIAAAAAAPTRLLPISPEPEQEPEPTDVVPSSQPEIVFPDTGAVAREAEPESTPPDPFLDTAERADAAIDDHFSSIFDDDEPTDE